MKTGKLIGALFALIGIGVIAIALFVANKTSDFIAHAVRAQGVVLVLVPVTGHQYGQYRFVDQNGQPHEFSPLETESPSPFTQGEAVDVLYLPQEPEGAKLGRYWSLWGGATILGVLGTVFTLFGAAFLFMLRGSSRKNADLKQTGVPVDTAFKEVKRLNIQVNGQYMYRIITTWRDPASQLSHTFSSATLDFDPSDSFDHSRPVRVYIALNNPKKYFMDLAMLEDAIA